MSSEQQAPPNAPLFVDTPLQKALRVAFDNPTINNLDALILEARATSLPSLSELEQIAREAWFQFFDTHGLRADSRRALDAITAAIYARLQEHQSDGPTPERRCDVNGGDWCVLPLGHSGPHTTRSAPRSASRAYISGETDGRDMAATTDRQRLGLSITAASGGTMSDEQTVDHDVEYEKSLIERAEQAESALLTLRETLKAQEKNDQGAGLSAVGNDTALVPDVKMTPYTVKMLMESADRVGANRIRERVTAFVYSELARCPETSYGKAQERVLRKISDLMDIDLDLDDPLAEWRVKWEPNTDLLMITKGAPVVADQIELAPMVCVRASRDDGRVVGLEVVEMQSFFDYLQACLDAAKAERAVTPSASAAQKTISQSEKDVRATLIAEVKQALHESYDVFDQFSVELFAAKLDALAAPQEPTH